MTRLTPTLHAVLLLSGGLLAAPADAVAQDLTIKIMGKGGAVVVDKRTP